MLDVKDKLEIQELEARYARATDTGDALGRSATFLVDGILEGGTSRFEGRAAIAQQTHDVWSGREANRFGAQPGEMQHWIHSLIIDGDDDNATALAYLALVVRGTSGPRIAFVGQYHDTLRKVDGRWFFAHKVSEPWQPASVKSQMEPAPD